MYVEVRMVVVGDKRTVVQAALADVPPLNNGGEGAVASCVQRCLEALNLDIEHVAKLIAQPVPAEAQPLRSRFEMGG